MSSSIGNCLPQPMDIPPESLSAIQNTLLSNLASAQTPCNLSSFNAAIQGKASSLLGSLSLSTDINQLNKTNCGDLAIVLQNVYSSVAQAKCAITNLGNSAQTDFTADQIFNVQAGNASKIVYPPGCSNPTWNFTQTVNYNGYSNVNSTVAQTLASIAQNGLQNTLDQLQANKQGYASTSSGSTQIASMQQTLSNKDTQSTILNNITKSINHINTTQRGNLTVGDNSVITLPCTLNMNSAIDIQVASIITSAYSGDIASQLGNFIKDSTTQKQKNTSGGLEDLFKAMGGGEGIALIIGAVVVIFLGIMLIKFMKSKKAQDLVSAASKNVGGAGGAGGAGKALGSLGELAAFRRRRF